MGNFKPIPSGKTNYFFLAIFEMLYDDMSVFQCSMCIYMYLHLESNINTETRHYIKMRRKHQRNSSHFPTEKCQMYAVKQ